MVRSSGYFGPNVNPTVINFDEVQFVIGEGLETLTSVFTAPVGGLYLFMHGRDNGNDGVSVTGLNVNGVRKRYTRMETIDESGSVTGLLKLSTGDQVHVELQPDSEIYCNDCYFDGVLLYQSL